MFCRVEALVKAKIEKTCSLLGKRNLAGCSAYRVDRNHMNHGVFTKIFPWDFDHAIFIWNKI